MEKNNNDSDLRDELSRLKTNLKNLPQQDHLSTLLKFDLYLEIFALKKYVDEWYSFDSDQGKKAYLKAAKRLIIKEQYLQQSRQSKAKEDFTSFLKREYPDVITKERYPLDWMIKDPKIKAVRDRYDLFDHILNFLFDYNRNWRDKDLERMKELNERVIGERYKHPKTGKKWEYATFVTDTEFYKKATDELWCSKESIRKYMQQFREIGFLKRWHFGTNNWLYSDGYFTIGSVGLVKIPFLTEAYYKALRDFSLH